MALSKRKFQQHFQLLWTNYSFALWSMSSFAGPLTVFSEPLFVAV